MNKVTALITRNTARGRELLLFEHPHGGNQLPAGTVEPGEPHAAAAAREAMEETGLADLPEGVLLAAVQEPRREEYFVTLVTTPVYARPELTSYSWATIRYGIGVRRHREEGDFSHVTFSDTYHRGDKTGEAYVSYQITGWLRTADLTQAVMRYFYHFPYHGRTPETWYAETDNHRFRLFWAPLDNALPIVPSQRWWVDVLREAKAERER